MPDSKGALRNNGQNDAGHPGHELSLCKIDCRSVIHEDGQGAVFVKRRLHI